MPHCTECRATTVWDDDAASDICTACGTLVDASQSLLTTHADPGSHGVPSSTLKSFRLGSNWDLVGQGKEARERKNSLAMAEYMRSLAGRLNAPGLSSRAIALFTQAKALAPFRWGRKANLVAGACLAIALRESRRPDALHDIAFLLTEKFPTLVSTLVSTASLLNISLTPSDPAFHIPDLANFLSCPQSHLPPPLLAQLATLCPRSAANTATSLSSLLSRLSPDHPINQLPSPPTACALILLALEGHLRSPLTNISNLAQSLAGRCHVGRAVVMERYKAIQDEINAWIERVPWLTKYERRKGRRNNRAKVSMRQIVALGLRDVVQFQDEIWRGQLKPSVALDTSDGEAGNSSDSDISASSTASMTPQLPLLGPPPKRQKTNHQPLHQATQFLLHPLSTPLPSSNSTPAAAILPPVQSYFASPAPCSPTVGWTSNPLPRQRSHRPPSLALASYILTAPSLSLSAPNMHLPTRLQMLVAERTGEDAITDDELFAPGELEALLRSDEDAENLRAKYIQLGLWNEHKPEEDEHSMGGKRSGKRQKNASEEAEKSAEGEAQYQSKRGRVDLEALARFLQDPVPLESGQDEKDADDAMFLGLERFDDEASETLEDDKDEYYDYLTADGEVIVDQWRPLSPQAGCSSHAEDYEEEYD